MNLYNIELSKTELGQVELVNCHFGQLAMCTSDHLLRNIIKKEGKFTEHAILEVSKYLSDTYKFTPEIFVDVGANVGTHCIFALKSGMYKSQTCIEPDPNNFRLLLVNSIINNVAHVMSFHCVALSDTTVSSMMELSPDNAGDNRIVTTLTTNTGQYNEQHWNKIIVDMQRMDDMFPSGLDKSKTMVWIDVQGHEGYVFQGGINTFDKQISPYIVCEFFPYGMKRAGCLDSVFQFLETRTEIKLLSHNQKTITSITIEDLKEHAKTTCPYWHIDLLLIP